MSTSKLAPSYYGYVGLTKDALLIIQSALDRQLSVVPRRPHERERTELIKSGNVFIFIEEHSGIKRWTDGISWSPSRILGRFLVYRELDKDSFSDDSSRKSKNKKRRFALDGNFLVDGLMEPRISLTTENIDSSSSQVGIQHGFKDQGLIKKTLSVTTSLKELSLDPEKQLRQTIHLISYYNANDVMNGRLTRPSESDLKLVLIHNHLWSAIKASNLGGKISIEDEAHYFLDTNYQLQNMAIASNGSGGYSGNYGASLSPTMGPPPPAPYYQKSNYMLPVPSSYDYYGAGVGAVPASTSASTSANSSSTTATPSYTARTPATHREEDPAYGGPYPQQPFSLSLNLNIFYHDAAQHHQFPQLLGLHQHVAHQYPQLYQLQYMPFPQHLGEYPKRLKYEIEPGLHHDEHIYNT